MYSSVETVVLHGDLWSWNVSRSNQSKRLGDLAEIHISIGSLIPGEVFVTNHFTSFSMQLSSSILTAIRHVNLQTRTLKLITLKYNEA